MNYSAASRGCALLTSHHRKCIPNTTNHNNGLQTRGFPLCSTHANTHTHWALHNAKYRSMKSWLAWPYGWDKPIENVHCKKIIFIIWLFFSRKISIFLRTKYVSIHLFRAFSCLTQYFFLPIIRKINSKIKSINIKKPTYFVIIS